LGLFLLILQLKFWVYEDVTSPEISGFVLEADLCVTALLAVDALDHLGVLVADPCDHGGLSDLHLLVLHQLQKVLSLLICHYSIFFLAILIDCGLFFATILGRFLLRLSVTLVTTLGGDEGLSILPRALSGVLT
jgi:hypothetical protein